MESSKWIAAAASIWIQCSCGASYAFGIYSSVLKSSQGYDQSTLDTVSVFKDIGANAGVLAGLLYTAASVPRRGSRLPGGPWVVLLAGAIQYFAGYFVMWLSVIGAISRLPVPAMCFFMLLAAHGQTFFNTTNVVTAVHNFPDYSGTSVGIMKGILGLSGAVLIQVYQTFLKGRPSTFILMLAVLPTSVSLLLMCLVRIYPTNNSVGDDKKYLDGFSSVALIVAAYLLILIILENLLTFPLWAHILTFVVLLLLLTSPLTIAIRAQEEHSRRLPQLPSNERSQLIESEKFSATEDSIEYHEETSDDGRLQLGKEMNLLQSIRTVNFWLLFIAMFCGMGSGLATVNNISQIGESLEYTTVEISTLVSLWSIWNFLGRFGAGYVSDVFLHTRGWARPLFMVLTLATMTAGHVVIAAGFPGNLYVGSVLVGICYGSQWSLMPTITSEIFGVLHMGTIFNAIAAASPVGSYIFSVLVIGYIYDKEASGEGNSCYGTRCFMLSFFILAAVSLSGFLVALILLFRTRSFYTQLFHTHLQRVARR
ncbi:Protein NUCLEAR FUSION DEFECTIVE like [Actinidia chinensis var. chinensis]|uniref:Protein NUCLEAR FUSION DEFECTIVE like n=1 Tax=Actinidia chinensis var. chinensis TaxID=1590841 RepID=A0A2R6QGV9_ACTCC|nr:Protein NUCLEAR FUSION DEFECTIVE like [Actinidia chinensis var. chinensis]